MKKFELVPNWKECPKWWSVRFGLIALIAETAQTLLPQWSALMPEPVQLWLTPTLVTLAVVGRLIEQEART